MPPALIRLTNERHKAAQAERLPPRIEHGEALIEPLPAREMWIELSVKMQELQRKCSVTRLGT
jgi:hypothetical protein